MEKCGDKLPVKLTVLVFGGLLLFVEAMIYYGAELFEYLGYLALHFLCLCCLAGVFFTPRKFRIWLWGGIVLFVVLSRFAEEHFPSIRQEFERMSCADIDLDYDETTGACVPRKD